jgi:periplasmic divalent cation tolerance protein
MSLPYQILFCTCPDLETASQLAHMLIQEKSAACVNILPGLISIYPWQDKIETAQEYLLIIKTREDQYQTVETLINTHHPYELPEIIAVPVERGLPDYLQWIDSCLAIK